MGDEISFPGPAKRTATRRQPCSRPGSDEGTEKEAAEKTLRVSCDHLIELFCIKLSDGLDHPAIWRAWPDFVSGFPAITQRLMERLEQTKREDPRYVALRIGQAMCRFHDGERNAALMELVGMQSELGDSMLLGGAAEYLRAGIVVRD